MALALSLRSESDNGLEGNTLCCAKSGVVPISTERLARAEGSEEDAPIVSREKVISV
jgi:hypothetical protein